MYKIVMGLVCILSFTMAELDRNKPLPLPETLKVSAEVINKSLPVMIDGELRHDKVEIEGNTMTLKFTLVNFTLEEMSAKKLKELMEADIRQGVCGDNETLMLLQKGMKVIYDYTSKDEKHMTQFEYDAKVCGLQSDIEMLKDILNLTQKN